ncbi:MAG: hypothetical protein MRY21_08585 [Simkaniaceae bacterium]|nr:hypothetical protein [Simkaniaceae bacterium]
MISSRLNSRTYSTEFIPSNPKHHDFPLAPARRAIHATKVTFSHTTSLEAPSTLDQAVTHPSKATTLRVFFGPVEGGCKKLSITLGPTSSTLYQTKEEHAACRKEIYNWRLSRPPIAEILTTLEDPDIDPQKKLKVFLELYKYHEEYANLALFKYCFELLDPELQGEVLFQYREKAFNPCSKIFRRALKAVYSMPRYYRGKGESDEVCRKALIQLSGLRLKKENYDNPLSATYITQLWNYKFCTREDCIKLLVRDLIFCVINKPNTIFFRSLASTPFTDEMRPGETISGYLHRNLIANPNLDLLVQCAEFRDAFKVYPQAFATKLDKIVRQYGINPFEDPQHDYTLHAVKILRFQYARNYWSQTVSPKSPQNAHFKTDFKYVHPLPGEIKSVLTTTELPPIRDPRGSYDQTSTISAPSCYPPDSKPQLPAK